MTTAIYSAEIEFEIDGDFTPATSTRMPNASDDVGEPGYGPFVENITVTRIGIPTYDRATKTHGTRWVAVTPALLSALTDLLHADQELTDGAAEAVIEAES